MRMPRSYVVRIYRQGYQSLSGLVEDVHSGAKRPFQSLAELIALLRAPIARAPTSRGGSDSHSDR